MTISSLAPLSPLGSRRHARARVLEKREVAPRHFALQLDCAAIARIARAGQFVHVLPHPREADGEFQWSLSPLLRRAFSVMDAQNDEFEILFRVEGSGTARIAGARPGDWLDLIGPLGNGFDLSQMQNKSAVLVGGGVGVPPMVFAARSLTEMGVPTQMLIGARSTSDVLCEERFGRLEVPLQVATDDGSRGHAGRVGDLLERALQENSEVAVLACGPYPMLRAVAAICEHSSVACQVSLEENMPCGIGVCNGCVVPMRAQTDDLGGDDYGRYRRICVHGPACDAREIDWT